MRKKINESIKEKVLAIKLENELRAKQEKEWSSYRSLCLSVSLCPMCGEEINTEGLYNPARTPTGDEYKEYTCECTYTYRSYNTLSYNQRPLDFYNGEELE